MCSALWLPGTQSIPLHTVGTGDMLGMDMAGLERSAQERSGK